MSNDSFSFKHFTIQQGSSAFKVGTDGVLLGATAGIPGAKKILDIGTGTGLVALMLAQRSEAEIVALEPDYDSYIEACSNVNNSKWSMRIKVFNSRLQDYLPGEEKFDLIVTNPPYFADSLKSPDPRRTAARHNDSLTSDEILKGAVRLMKEDGKLQLIMPYAEGNIFIAEAQGYGLYCNNVIKIKPLPSAEIRRLILTFSRQRLKTSEKFLTIEHGKRHEFTEEYINLTKEFYLKF
jgi:tRNA1Val (adenine37-N6)-methyltransferase